MNTATIVSNVAIKSMLLERIPFAIRKEFGRDILMDMELSEFASFCTDSIVLEVRWFMHGKKQTRRESETVYVPLTWWDAVKERFVPAWLKHSNRITINYKKIVKQVSYEETKICPHLDIPSQGTGRFAHIAWIDGPMLYEK